MIRLVAAALLLLGAPAVAAPPACATAWTDWAPPAAGGDYARHRERFPREGCVKAWTVLVWLAGDAEDLVEPMRQNLDALMAGGGSTPSIDVLVHQDRHGPDNQHWMHVFADQAAGVAVSNEGVPPARSLQAFLEWGVTQYPAERYAVILAGHGLGWRPILTAAPDDAGRFDLKSTWGGFAFDATQKTVLDTPSLRTALAAVVDRQLGGQPFDLLLTDACLMQSLEVLVELADVARYIGGSEQVQPYVGLPYADLLKDLQRPGEAPGCADRACTLAKRLPAMQARALRRNPAVEAAIRDQYTYSTVDTSALRLQLLPALAELIDVGIDGIERQPEAAAEWGVMLSTAPGFLGGFRDLGVIGEQVLGFAPPGAGRPARALNAAARSLRYALETTVVARSLGETYTRDANGRYTGMRGISLWLPLDAADTARRWPFFAGSRLHRTLGDAPGTRVPRLRQLIERIQAPPALICPTP